MRLSGKNEVKRNLKAARDKIAKAVASGVYGVANEIMTDAKRRVPVQYGVLKGSGYVTEPEITGDTAHVEMGFGGPAKDYAVVQHENTHLHHPDGGEAKFLENALNAAISGAVARIHKIARRQLRAGGEATIPGVHPTNPNEGER